MLQVTIDSQANTACRTNNKTICEADEEEPQPGGNIEAYKKLNAYPDLDNFVEFTQIKWPHSAQLLVCF